MDIGLKVSPPLDTGPRPLYLVCRVCDSMRVTELKKSPNVSAASRSANPGRIVNSQGYSVIEDVPSPVKARWLFSELGTPAPARWVDFSGPVGLGWAGVTLMDHPTNMGHPPQIVTRCYGLSAIGRRYPHGISQGVLELKYRVFVHLGDHKEAHVDRNYRAYVNPPKVEVGTPEYSQQ